MENMEMPTQMTNNVPTTIGGGALDSSFGKSDIAIHETDVSIQEADRGIQIDSFSEVSTEIISNKPTAELLLDSAKEDGFEEALQKLIDGEFERDEVAVLDEIAEDEVGVKNKSELSDSAKSLDVADGETIDIYEDGIELPIEDRIMMLEEKVEIMQEESKELLERVRKVDAANRSSHEMMLVFLKMLYEATKQEEREEQKVSMLELIVKMLTIFMQEIMTDGHVETQKEQNETVKVKNRRSSIKSDQLKAIINDLERQGAGNVIDINIQRPKSPQPQVEMVAS